MKDKEYLQLIARFGAKKEDSNWAKKELKKLEGLSNTTQAIMILIMVIIAILATL